MSIFFRLGHFAAFICAALLVFAPVAPVRGDEMVDAPYVPPAGVIRGVIGALEDPHEEVVLAAIQSLTDWGAAEAIPAMTKLLGAEVVPRVRAAAFHYYMTLGAGSRGSLPALVAYMDDADAGVRERIIQSIAAAGAAPEYLDKVVPKLADARKEVRVAAAVCVGKAGKAAREHREALMKALARAGSAEFKVAIIDALTSIGDLSRPQAEAVAEFQGDRDGEVRIAAAAAVFDALLNAERAGMKAEFQPLRTKAMSRFRLEPPEVRGAILKHAMTDPETARQALEEMAGQLKEKQPEPRIAALFAIGMAGKTALPHVPAVLEQFKSEDDNVRAAALAALRGIGQEAVEPNMEIVLRAMLEPSEAVRAEALLALPLCGAALKNRSYRFVDVFRDAKPEVRQTLLSGAAVFVRTLGPNDESMAGVMETLNDPDAERRIGGCFIAGQLGAKNGAIAFPKLLALVTHKSADVRGAAAIALRSYPADEDGRLKIRRALAPLLADDDDHVRWAALDTLAECQPGQDAALLTTVAGLLNDPDRSVRNAALRTLGAAGPAAKKHFPAMVGMFTDNPETPPYGAGQAVLQLGPLGAADIASLLHPAYVDADVRPIVRLAAYGASAGKPELLQMLRLLGGMERPAAAALSKDEIPVILTSLKEAASAPRLHPKLKSEIDARIRELQGL